MGNQQLSGIKIETPKQNKNAPMFYYKLADSSFQTMNFPCSIVDSFKQLIAINGYRNKNAVIILQSTENVNQIKLINKRPQNNLYMFMLTNQVQTLKENDIVKIGNYKITVKQIALRSCSKKYIGRNPDFEASYLNSNAQMQDSAFISGRSRMMQCRVCFQIYSDSQNPLLNPCDCQGSVKFIHFHCLRDWIGTNFVKKTQKPGSIRYRYQRINCDLCKKQIPRWVKTSQKLFDLVIRQKFLAPFITLQVDSNQSEKNIYIFQLNENEPINIGNSLQNNMFLNLKSEIPQQFLSFIYTNRTVQLTNRVIGKVLIKVRGKIEIEKNQIITFLYKNRIFRLCKEQQQKFLNSCYTSSDKYVIQYQESNEN